MGHELLPWEEVRVKEGPGTLFPVDVQEKVGALALLAHQLDKPPSYCLDPYFIFFPQ